MVKAIFLDRDGVINKKMPEGSYVTNWHEFRFISGVKEAISSLSKTDYKIIIATNQRGIAKKILSEKNLIKLHLKMLDEIKKSGGRVDKIYFCPHEKGECNCRKPLPGMLYKANKEFNIDFKNSWIIGDSSSDIELGKKLGCKTVLIGDKNKADADFVFNNLNEAIKILI